MYNMGRRRKETPAWVTIIRIILALVFIVSGFLKAVDPWGTAIQLDEYFTAFHMEWLSGARYVLSILQSGFEMWLGLLLLLNQMRWFSRFFVMLFMIFFTILTLIIALTNPVSDCGCFGEAIKLTNWETFFKNVVLLPMSILLFAHTRLELTTTHPRHLAIVASLILSFLPGLAAMNSLPRIDFLPYKVGTNIAGKMTVAPELQGESKTTVIYRNRETGIEQEFEVSDTTWYDGERWEFVDTRTVVLSEGVQPEITNFVIFDRQQDVTYDLLMEEEVFLLVADRLEDVSEKAAARFGRTARFAQDHGIEVVCLTTSSLDGAARFQQQTGVDIPCYNIDATTLKTMLRAHNGLIILERGTILAKKNLRQVPDFEKKEYDSGLHYVIENQRKNGERIFVIVYIVLILGLLLGKCNRYKN